MKTTTKCLQGNLCRILCTELSHCFVDCSQNSQYFVSLGNKWFLTKHSLSFIVSYSRASNTKPKQNERLRHSSDFTSNHFPACKFTSVLSNEDFSPLFLSDRLASTKVMTLFNFWSTMEPEWTYETMRAGRLYMLQPVAGALK